MTPDYIASAFWSNVDEFWLNRELLLQGYRPYDVTQGKAFDTAEEILADLEAPALTFHHTIRAFQCVEDGDWLALSLIAPTWCSYGHQTAEDAAAEVLEQEARYFVDARMASDVTHPFRFPGCFFINAELAATLTERGYAKLPDRNGGDDDFVVVDVRSRAWIYGEGGCGLHESRVRNLHRLYPDWDLARINDAATA